jgi:hypothetical protein
MPPEASRSRDSALLASAHLDGPLFLTRLARRQLHLQTLRTPNHVDRER